MLNTTASSIQYRGDGKNRAYPIPFPFLENSHIHAHVDAGDGTSRTLAPGADYTISRSGGGGELTLLAGNFPPGQLLTIRRLLPLTQEIFFHNQGPQSPRAIEEAADRLTMISQQLQAGIDRCLRAPDEETAAALSGAAADNAARLAAVEDALTAKAGLDHDHSPADIAGLSAALAAKAGADETFRALAGKASAALVEGKADITALAAKADRTELAAKADASALAAKADRLELAAKAERTHSHSLPDVDGLAALLAGKVGAEELAAALAGKLNADDPRLDAVGGGTADHAKLGNRDAPDQHPQSAVQYLTADLESLRAGIAELADGDAAAASRLAALGARLDGAENNAAGLARDIAGLAGDVSGLAALPPRVAAAESALGSVADGVAGLSAELGSVRSAVAGVSSDMGLIRDDVLGVASELGSLRTEVAGVASGLPEVETDLDAVRRAVEAMDALLLEVSGAAARLGTRVDALGSLSFAADAPEDGVHYTRQNRAWVALPAPPPVSPPVSGGTGGGIVGDIRLLPFRADALPGGWYFCDGSAFPEASEQGRALLSLPPSYRADWGVVLADGMVTLPDLFDASTGAGLFLRGVDGAARLPGSAQGDAIRNITGKYEARGYGGGAVATGLPGEKDTVLEGAFTTQAVKEESYTFSFSSTGARTGSDLLFDASLVVPVAEENRPVNVGMTPAVYLGV